MNMKWKLFVILLTVFSLSKAQKSETVESLIIGEWVGVKKETKNGRNRLNNGELMKELGHYKFLPKGEGIVYYGKEFDKVPYSIDGNKLKFGRLYFIIEKIDEKELVLLDLDISDPNNYLAFRHYFARKIGQQK